MAKWLAQASPCHEMCCHCLEVMSSNPDRVELGVCRNSVEVVLDPKMIIGNVMHVSPQKFILYLVAFCLPAHLPTACLTNQFVMAWYTKNTSKG